MIGWLGGEIISLMMVCLILMIGVGSGVGVGVGDGDGRTISFRLAGSGRGTGTGIGEGFAGEILKGDGSSLGILTLPLLFSIKPLIKPKFLELVKLVKLEKRLAPEKILVKLKSPAKAKGVFKKQKPATENTRIRDNLDNLFDASIIYRILPKKEGKYENIKIRKKKFKSLKLR